MPFEIIHKPTFTHQLLALPREQVPRILEKMTLLAQDPAPHGDLKKKLHGYKGAIYRLRAGDYRVIYTYGDGWVALLGVDDRKDVYKGDRLTAEETALDVHTVPDVAALLEPEAPPPPAPEPGQGDAERLPVELDEALLARLHVPPDCRPALRACRTLDDLIAAAVPEAVRERVFAIVTQPDFDRVLDQPSYALDDADDLLRFVDGELTAFLLKLSAEQQRVVAWAVNAAGPTLVKGGPGTGKSTVALYRARVLLETLRRQGSAAPRLLFTTYTNALVAFSEQLLRGLLGADACRVEVRTADSIVMGLAPRLEVATPEQARKALREALHAAPFEGNTLQQRVQAEAVARLHPDYLLEEINGVIEGRELATLDDYLAAARPGRAVALNATQRRAVWAVYCAFVEQLRRRKLQTWSQARRRAVERVRSGAGPAPYDAVIVDEAQDLEPTVLRLLVALCAAPNRLFVAADADQSIYGAGFRWPDVHATLRFGGRTSVLRANYRSTREIDGAARAYLAGGALDEQRDPPRYLHSGPLPAVRAVTSASDQAQLLARFLPNAARAFQLRPEACAVLVPSEQAGKSVAAELSLRGVEAAFMAGKELDLARRCVKVLTLKSAKGLEFPVVALAGFVGERYPALPLGLSDEEEQELLRRERRTLFVGMTRAMRALLVVAPEGRVSPLLRGFDPALWNLG